MKFSFIIPALDEEKRIGDILKQFKSLKGKYDYEIIVADGGSRDKTRSIARNLGARVVTNNRDSQTIAKNRNLGARNARNEIILFCDADTRFKNLPRLLDSVSSLFKNQEIIAASLKIEVFPEEKIWKDKIIQFIQNNAIKLSFLLRVPFSSGQCQVVRKEAFDIIGGYREDMVHGEDSFLFKDLEKYGRLYYFSDHVIYESPRRYRKWGYLRWIFIGTVDLFSYMFFKRAFLKRWKRVG